MKSPKFKAGEAVEVCPGFTYPAQPCPRHETIYHISCHLWIDGIWYVQLKEIGCLNAYTEHGFKRPSRWTKVKTFANATEQPF